MSLYETYVLVANNQVDQPPVIAEHNTDADAALAAFGLGVDGLAVEVWQEARLVFRLNGGQLAAVVKRMSGLSPAHRPSTNAISQPGISMHAAGQPATT